MSSNTAKRVALVVLWLVGLLARNAVALKAPRTLASSCATKTSTSSINKVLKVNRGGDLGSIDGKILAKTFSFLASLDAICGALIPRTSMKYFGVYIAKDSLSNKCMHGIGASAATIAVASFLAVNGIPIEQAIGYGFAARLVSMTLMILTDNEKKVGMRFSMFGAMWMVLAATVYALFTKSMEPLTLTKVVSVVLGMHGLFLYFKPEVFLPSVAVGPDPLVKDMLSIDGGYMVASAVLTGLLAQGLEPVKVVGYTAISFVPVILKFVDVLDTEKFFGISPGLMGLVISVMMACIIVGTLH